MPQIECIGDGGRRCWASRRGGNARNRVCTLTTGMRTTHGQAAFGHNIQLITTYSKMVKTYFETCTVGRVFSMRVERTYSGIQTFINNVSMNYRYLQIVNAKLSRCAKQHPSNSGHLMRRFVRGLSICVHQLSIRAYFQA
jgi:hypothetical protein